MAKKRIPNQEILDEIARLTKDLRFVFGNNDHYQLQEAIGKLEHKLMFKQKSPKDNEEITRLRHQVGWLINKIKSEIIGLK